MHSQFCKNWDNNLENRILDKIKSLHNNQCRLSPGIFNFSSTEIPDEIAALLKHPKNMIFETKESHGRIKKRITSECFNYAVKFRASIEKNTTDIGSTEDHRSWLLNAINTARSNDFKQFYFNILHNLKTLRFQPPNPSSPTIKNLEQIFEIPDNVWMETDKEMGFALIPIPWVKSAEAQLLVELGASKIELSKSQLVNQINVQIMEFFSSLDGEQLHLLKNYFPEIKLADIEIVEVPFLNMKPKVIKLSQLDLQMKNLSVLKYRPVIDQSKWVFSVIGTVLMQILTTIKAEVLTIEDHLIPNIFVKNGAEVSTRLKSLDFDSNDYSMIISADLSDAYSNVMLSDLETAIEFLGTFTNLAPSTIEVAIGLARLILKNNYIECVSGYYKLQVDIEYIKNIYNDIFIVSHIYYDLIFAS